MADERLDMLREKIFSDSDARLRARIASLVDPVANELEARSVAVNITRADGSVFTFAPAPVIQAIKLALFNDQRDAFRDRAVVELLRRVANMTRETRDEAEPERSVR